MAQQTGSPYSCASQQDAKRQNSSCNQDGDAELARISTHAFIQKGVIAKSLVTAARAGLPGAAQALALAITAAELACLGYVIREASGSYDGGSPVTGKATGRNSEQTISTKHVISGSDPKYVGNELFWANMRATAKKYDYFGGTSSRAWVVQNQSIAIDFKPAITDVPTDQIAGDFTVTYNDLNPLLSVGVDMEALGEAPFLPYTGLSAGATNAATLTSTATLERIAVGSADLLSYTAAFTGAVDYSIRPESGALLPLGLSVAVDTGILTWTPTVAQVGTYQVFLRGESACGVLGEVELEIIVS